MYRRTNKDDPSDVLPESGVAILANGLVDIVQWNGPFSRTSLLLIPESCRAMPWVGADVFRETTRVGRWQWLVTKQERMLRASAVHFQL